MNRRMSWLALALLACAACGDDDDQGGGGTGAGGSGADGGGAGVNDGGAGGTGGQDGGSGGGAACNPEGGLDISVCASDAGPFALTSDNPFFPFAVGDLRVYEGDEEGVALHLEIEVLDETEIVDGITTRVIEERETEDGEIVEISRNFFAQAADGTVCYFGEDVDIYEGGEIVSHDGEWRAGGANHAGIIMPPDPAVGVVFQQEDAAGVAEDQATVVAKGESVTVPLDTYTDTIDTEECTPLEPGHLSLKSYAAGVGLLVDAAAELIEFSPGPQ